MNIFGWVAQLAFGLRFIVQLAATEKAKKSVTPELFWHLSILGNLLLFVHSLIHLHLPMSIAQSQNLILSLRNLDLQKQKILSFWHVIGLLILSALSTIYFFFEHASEWVWGEPIELFGIMGIMAFGLRFWVQWWQAEQENTGELTESFWWISLVGAIICTIYFFETRDWVNFIGPLLSIVPYSRNLYYKRL